MSSCLYIKLNIPEDKKEYIKKYHSLKESIKILAMINLRLSLYLNNYCKKYSPKLNDNSIINVLMTNLLKKGRKFSINTHQISESSTLTIQSNKRSFFPYLFNNKSSFNLSKVKSKHVNQYKQIASIQFPSNTKNNSQSIYSNIKHSNLFLSSLPTYSQCAKECSSSLLSVQPNLYYAKEQFNKSNSIANTKEPMNLIDKYILNTHQELNKNKKVFGFRMRTSNSMYNLKVIHQSKKNSNDCKMRGNDIPIDKQNSLYSFSLSKYFKYDNEKEKIKKKDNEGKINCQSNKKISLSQLKTAVNYRSRDLYTVKSLSNAFIKNKILAKIQRGIII